MKVNAIKREIPAAISELGGAQVVLVGKETTELETSIQEAQDGLYVIGDKLLIKGFFVGLFKSMIAGIQRDGHARTLGDFLTLYPVPTGEIDLEKGWDPEKNDIRIRVRLMNELSVDISSWEFVDVTPGRQPFKLESVKAGDVLGVIQLDKPVEINGKPMPLTEAIRVDWAVEGTALSGTVPSAKVTSTVSRADIAADALAALNVPGNDGKTIVFTVRGNYANAKISGVLKYCVPPIYTSAKGGLKVMSGVDSHGNALPAGTLKVSSPSDVVTLTGVNLKATDEAHPTTGITRVYLQGLTQENIDVNATYDETAGTMTLQLGMAVWTSDPGTYENVRFSFFCYTNGEGDSLQIPFKFVRDSE